MGDAPAAWQLLNARIVTCRACPRLTAWREQVAAERRKAYRDWEYWGRPVPGFGDPAAKVLIIGLAPGAHGSNRTGRMFTGDSSGDFLYAALHRAGLASQPTAAHRDDGLTLHGAFITAVCRCVPPGNKPAPAEIAACRPFLQAEISLLPQARVVVALGRVAFEQARRQFPLDGSSPGEAVFRHGGVYRLAGAPQWLVASYHPSRQNTQTGRLTPAMFDVVWQEVVRLGGSAR